MQKTAVFLIIAVVAILVFLMFMFLPKGVAENKVEKTSEKKSFHSDTFNRSVDTVLNSYFALTDAFVQWDSTNINKLAAIFSKNVKSLQFTSSGNRKIDASHIEEVEENTVALIKAKDLTSKRRSLHILSEHLYSFLKNNKYDNQKLFLQNCPMAFNDEEDGQWLSSSAEIKNPYLGLYHPRYGKGMLKCGDTKEILNFSGER